MKIKEYYQKKYAVPNCAVLPMHIRNRIVKEAKEKNISMAQALRERVCKSYGWESFWRGRRIASAKIKKNEVIVV
jgi:hypothetical protein